MKSNQIQVEVAKAGVADVSVRPSTACGFGREKVLACGEERDLGSCLGVGLFVCVYKAGDAAAAADAAADVGRFFLITQ